MHPNQSTTPSPIASPSGRTGATLTQRPQQTRHRVYIYGDHEDVVNPGDMLIVSTVGDLFTTLEVRTYINGRDIAPVAEAALSCMQQYDENREWLSAPVTSVGGAA